ncbi:MAG: hypothetical protein PHR16_15550 [Methylovulum sp.]|nr:hypothetical protein [Methylovulum sp.]
MSIDQATSQRMAKQKLRPEVSGVIPLDLFKNYSWVNTETVNLRFDNNLFIVAPQFQRIGANAGDKSGIKHYPPMGT